MTPPVEREAEHATLHVSPSVPKRQADRVANAKGGVGGTPRPGVGHGRGRGRRARRWERGRHVGATSGGQSTANHSAPPSKLRDRAAEQRMRAMGACEGVGGGGRNAVRRVARFGRHWGHTPPLPHGVPVGGEANTACRPGSGGLQAARRRRCGGASGQSSQLGAALARAFLRSSWAFAEGASTCCGGASFEKRKKSGPLHAPPADLACHWWSHWSEGSPSGPPPSGGLLGKIDMAINFFVGARGKARSCRGPPARWAPLARKATSREPGPKLLARFLGASPPRGQGPSRLSSHRQAAETKHVGYPTTSLSLPVHRSLPLLSCLCFSSGAGSSNTTTVCCRGIGAPYCEGTVCLRNDPCRAASTHSGTGSPAVMPAGPRCRVGRTVNGLPTSPPVARPRWLT